MSKTTIQISKNLHHIFKLIAAYKNTNYESVLEELIKNYIDNNENKAFSELVKKQFQNNKVGKK
jgi:hypothetical protein